MNATELLAQARKEHRHTADLLEAAIVRRVAELCRTTGWGDAATVHAVFGRNELGDADVTITHILNASGDVLFNADDP
jgi:hypothetical protein